MPLDIQDIQTNSYILQVPDCHRDKRPKIEVSDLLNDDNQPANNEGFNGGQVQWVFPIQPANDTTRQLADAVSYMGSILLNTPQVDARALSEKLSPISHVNEELSHLSNLAQNKAQAAALCEEGYVY